MKLSKIFNWLYFIILLLPILFVFLPMINNYQPTVKSENVEIIEYGSLNNDITPFLIDISYSQFNDFYNISFNDLYPYFKYYGYENNDHFSMTLVDSCDNIYYFEGYFKIYYFPSGDFVCGLKGFNGTINNQTKGLITFNNDDDDDIYESFSFHLNVIDPYDQSLMLIFDAYEYSYYEHIYLFYYKDYIINTEYNSILYDFSVKMNDSIHIMGDFTEYIDSNIIDLQVNDYMFFGWTYMIYIFIISLLWLLISFLIFIIKWCYNFLGGVYEKV